jgi:hypothetical protein
LELLTKQTFHAATEFKSGASSSKDNWNNQQDIAEVEQCEEGDSEIFRIESGDDVDEDRFTLEILQPESSDDSDHATPK